MLLDVLASSGSFSQKLLTVLIIAFSVFLSLSIHEMSHGLAAYLIGDKTAKYSGRISLNPLHHLDPVGALCLLLFGFGWAKPVPVNPWNFKYKRAGMAITAFAGPFSNFIVAFIAFLIYAFLPVTNGVLYVISLICNYLIVYNIGLGVFNLIPIPPLDGSKILGAILPRHIYFKLMEYERYGFIILIVLINTPFFRGILNRGLFGMVSLFEKILQLFV